MSRTESRRLHAVADAMTCNGTQCCFRADVRPQIPRTAPKHEAVSVPSRYRQQCQRAERYRAVRILNVRWSMRAPHLNRALIGCQDQRRRPFMPRGQAFDSKTIP